MPGGVGDGVVVGGAGGGVGVEGVGAGAGVGAGLPRVGFLGRLFGAGDLASDPVDPGLRAGGTSVAFEPGWAGGCLGALEPVPVPETTFATSGGGTATGVVLDLSLFPLLLSAPPEALPFGAAFGNSIQSTK